MHIKQVVLRAIPGDFATLGALVADHPPHTAGARCVPTRATAKPAAASSRAPQRVLVVDDEQDLCDHASAWLQSIGCEVTSARSPQPALEQLATQRFDVLFTDIVMPGPMDGLELARTALQRSPGLRVLFASGYARNINDQTILPGAQLNEPCRKKELPSAFQRLTDAIA